MTLAFVSQGCPRAIAECQREHIRERVLNGLQRVRTQGKRLGGTKQGATRHTTTQAVNDAIPTTVRDAVGKAVQRHKIGNNLIIRRCAEALQR